MINASSGVADLYSRWIEAVANAAEPLLNKVSSRRTVKFIENESGGLELHLSEKNSSDDCVPADLRVIDGQLVSPLPPDISAIVAESRIELILQPHRFLFRPVELPSRATEFLTDVVRTQIDRLTPWNADAAAYGWSAPVGIDDDRIVVTIAATARDTIQPLVRALAGAGANSTLVFATSPDEGNETSLIKIWDETSLNRTAIGGIRSTLTTILALAAIFAGGAIALSATVGDGLARQRVDLLRTIGSHSNSSAGAQTYLGRRKHDGALIVLVVEMLSRILPDHTHITELRVEDRTLRLSGFTRDAPALIGLLEQAGQLSKVRFFAPTTQSDAEPGARFHIEAEIKPISMLRS